jgi:uncharacterized protein YjbI with pentapeptide repeats
MKIAAPKLPPSLATYDPWDLVDEAVLETCQMSDASFNGKTIRSANFDEVILDKVSFIEATLEKLSCRDVIFNGCDLSTANCSDCSMQRVTLAGGRMTGLDVSKGYLKDITFKDCKLNMANFRFARLKLVTFIDCVLTDADFLGADMVDVSFQNCLIERVEFGHSNMKQVDLRGSQLVDIKGWQSLKGAIIDKLQLVQAAQFLANDYGIIVKD